MTEMLEGVEQLPSAQSLIDEAQQLFSKHFGTRATHGGLAPGRVNLIGDHVDYQNGLVLPMGLGVFTVVVGTRVETGVSEVRTLSEAVDEPHVVNFEVNKVSGDTKKPKWANYVRGVVNCFHDQHKLANFKAIILTSVPLGGGLSSSASLEVAMYTFLESLFETKAASDSSKALACQKAEHEFAGVPCGIMDQMVCVKAEEKYALLIDCKSLKTEKVPLNWSGLSVLVTNSNYKHTLSESPYPLRRAQCEAGAKTLGLETLRDASMELVESNKHKFDSVESLKRSRHVVREIDHVLKAVEELKKNNFEAFGVLMNASHNSLRDDFECVPEPLDHLVQVARSVEGVLGSRITGGGFGGCTVTLVRTESLDKLIMAINEKYEGKANFIVAQPSQGARVINA